MGQVNRGGDFMATFQAAASLSVLYEDVNISAADTVNLVATFGAYPIGTVAEVSSGGANSSVLINMFTPTRLGIARGIIGGGGLISHASTTSGYIATATNGASLPIGIAVSAASVTGEIFEFIPWMTPGLTLA